MKKILIAFLTISLLAAMMAIPVAAAAPAASMNSVSAAPGETVTLTVSLAGIEKATSIGIEIVADEELTYLDSSAWLIPGEIAHVDSDKAAWVGNAYVSGDILALEYKLPEGKMAPVYQVRLTIDVVNHPATVAAGLTVTGTITCAHNYIPTVHAPTCTTLGYTSYECGYCGDTSKENDNYVNVSHDWVEATCLAPKTCALCGATEGELGDHAWSNWTVIEEPTCEEEGLRTRSCTREGCDHSESEAIKATGHNYEPDVIPPTCTEEGYTDYICANCGASYMEDKVDALGHDWSDWDVTIEPTTEETGVKTRWCQREGCTAQESEVIPALPVTEGWTEIDGKWYFYENGAPKTGWHEEGGRYYYFRPDGVMATGWEKITGVWYYMEPSGARAVGWQLINGDYYYFYASGVMKTGWLSSGGKRYFFRPDGAMSTGWVQYGGKWYCMDETGAMVTGWMERGGEKYYMDADGVMVTGTVTIDGTIHEFDENGVWQGSVTPKDGWVQENGKWYFYENGKAKIGWHEEGGKYYYFGTDCAMSTGWVKIGQVWYYMEPSGARATGWNLINGSYYYFYSSGVMKTGWLNSGGKRYFFRPDGAMATGWVEYAGKWYYMNESGAMVTGTYTIKGTQYTFDANGVWIP